MASADALLEGWRVEVEAETAGPMTLTQTRQDTGLMRTGQRRHAEAEDGDGAAHEERDFRHLCQLSATACPARVAMCPSLFLCVRPVFAVPFSHINSAFARCLRRVSVTLALRCSFQVRRSGLRS